MEADLPCTEPGLSASATKFQTGFWEGSGLMIQPKRGTILSALPLVPVGHASAEGVQLLAFVLNSCMQARRSP